MCKATIYVEGRNISDVTDNQTNTLYFNITWSTNWKSDLSKILVEKWNENFWNVKIPLNVKGKLKKCKMT